MKIIGFVLFIFAALIGRKLWQSMMPYCNEGSGVRPGCTGGTAQGRDLSQTAAHTLQQRSAVAERGDKTTTVINRALETTLTTEVL